MVILIVGSSRTGTTMLGRLLHETGETHLVPELHFFDELFVSSASQPIDFEVLKATLPLLLSRARSSYYDPEGITQPLIDEATRLARLWRGKTSTDVFLAFLSYEKERVGARSICEQTPRNIEFLNEIQLSKKFLECKVILTIRDPDAVVLSQKYRYLRRKLGGDNIGYWRTLRTKLAFNVIAMSLAWLRAAMLVEKYCGHDQMYLFRYESYLVRREETTKALLSFCKIAPEQQEVSVPYAGSSITLDGADNKDFNSNRRLTCSERAIVSTICGRAAQSFDYEVQQQSRATVTLSFLWHIWAFFLSIIVRTDLVVMYLRKLLSR